MSFCRTCKVALLCLEGGGSALHAAARLRHDARLNGKGGRAPWRGEDARLRG